ncbi:MAG TPA: hypothetical protein VH110_05215 [Candidatus Acidoferrum sp.]|jgi:hypothetical protein|nr:hypothetical protein [Candidatus Acidoferrum sp.]
MSESRVYLAQLLCPERHAFLAAVDVYENEKSAEELGVKLLEEFNHLVAQHFMKPSCALCGASEFHVEVRRTGFRTMEEALPSLKASEAAQLLTQALWKASRN